MSETIELKRNYISVRGWNVILYNVPSYGGSQSWFESKSLQGYGCGLIGAADVLLYLRGERFLKKPENKPEENKKTTALTRMQKDSYLKYVEQQKKFFPVLPYFGMSGITLAVGLKAAFLRYHLQYKVRWGVPRKKIRTAIEEMLRDDIPVILAVGPNFPFMWRKKGVPIYQQIETGEYYKSQEVRAHYVVITGVLGKWLRISSWGNEYFMDWEEYERYVKKMSWSLISNICYIRKK